MNQIGLSAISDDWDKNFKLMADIDLSVYTGTQFNIIGTRWDNVFTGVFDGNGHTISNFTYTSTNRQYIGIFGYVSGANAEIKNLGLIAPVVDAGTGSDVGSLAGYFKEGTMSNCYVEGGSVAGQYGVGGLLGEDKDGTITNCCSSSSVSGRGSVGGLVGFNDEGTITCCYSFGIVEGEGSSGGLVGSIFKGLITDCYASGHVLVRDYMGGGLVGLNVRGRITNCYSTGTVSGGSDVGGLVGVLQKQNYSAFITNCYSNGSVSGDRNVGGLVGSNIGTVTNCYSTGCVSGNDNVGGLVGNDVLCGSICDKFGCRDDCYYGETNESFWDFQTSSPSTSAGGVGLTTAEMQAASTFIAWGCGSVWTIEEGVDYPRLVWENAPGEPITAPSYGGGSGEPNDPYLIYTAEQLNTIGLIPGHLDKHFKLMADLDLDTLPPPPPPHLPPSLFKAGNPNPAHGVLSVSLTADLSWMPGLGATSHDVYFGTNSIPPFVCNQTSTTFDPGTMAFGTKYYWHIDEVNDSVVTAGEIWNFTTIPPPPTPPPLTAEVDLGQFEGENTRPRFNVIGHRHYDGGVEAPFSGVFDGNGHTISNFTYTSTDKNNIGLFGYVTGLIKNLGLIDPNVDAGTGCSVGSLVGRLSGGATTGCYVKGGCVSGNDDVGGMVGEIYSPGTITNCYSTGSVSGDSFIGGMVGSGSGTITNCYSTGSVYGRSGVGGFVGYVKGGDIRDCYAIESVFGDHAVGGLVGSNEGGIINCYSGSNVSGGDYVGGLVGEIHSGKISNCYSTGSVSGDRYVGGLVGENSDYATIINCYAIGSVVGSYNAGGLVGSNSANVITSFWDIQTSGQDTSDAGTGLPTAQMQTTSTFIAWTTCGKQGIWTLDEGNDYPHLWWEEKPGEPLPAYQLSDFMTGAGTQIHPYLIYTPRQLNMIGLFFCDRDRHFKLMADIDLSNFTGTSFNIIKDFAGVFDGNGKKIFNFTYTSNEKSYIGLFGSIEGENAVIRDLGLIDPKVDAGPGSYVGSLVAYLEKGSISNCYVEGGSVAGDSYIGGLVGYSEGDIRDCYATGSVFGDYSVGGLVGYNTNVIVDSYTSGNVTGGYCVGGLCGKSTGPDHSTVQSSIRNCYSTANVTGYGSAGGLIGHSGAIVTGCYSRGSVSGHYYVGGLIGRNGGHGSIKNCYSTGSVVGEQSLGGLVGSSEGTVSASFWDIETSGQDSSDSGTGKTTAEMQTMSTFTDAGWDFVGETVNGIEDIWFIGQQDYPHLWWQGMQVPVKLNPATLNCRSQGNWVKTYLTLPEGFTISDVDAERPAVLHSFGFQSAPLYVSVNKSKLVQIEAAFERQALCSLADDWPDTLTVAAFLADGNIFLGTSKVRIIDPGSK
jgi:hypothetical protein